MDQYINFGIVLLPNIIIDINPKNQASAGLRKQKKEVQRRRVRPNTTRRVDQISLSRNELGSVKLWSGFCIVIEQDPEKSAMIARKLLNSVGFPLETNDVKCAVMVSVTLEMVHRLFQVWGMRGRCHSRHRWRDTVRRRMIKTKTAGWRRREKMETNDSTWNRKHLRRLHGPLWTISMKHEETKSWTKFCHIGSLRFPNTVGQEAHWLLPTDSWFLLRNTSSPRALPD